MICLALVVSSKGFRQNKNTIFYSVHTSNVNKHRFILLLPYLTFALLSLNTSYQSWYSWGNLARQEHSTLCAC